MSDKPEGKILYRLVTKPEDRITPYDDMADEYVVVEEKTALGGVIEWARYGEKWVVNPWSTRWSTRILTRKLIERIAVLEEQLGKTSDGVLFFECEKFYCPECGGEVEGDSFVAYCWNCSNPDAMGKIPLPLSWGSTTSKPMGDKNWRNK